MRLSVCMIVRDEEEALPRCLASLRGVADELCVVDTGSTDRTVEVARAAGARVEHAPWRGDFSAARNVALAMARGRWILSIDADEELDADTAPALRAALEDPAALGFLVEVDSLLADGRHQPALLPRLFRSRPDIRFARAVHESVMDSLHALGAAALRPSGVRLVHHGYLPEVVRARDKRGRNLAILRAEVARDPDDLYALHKLAGTLSAPGEQPERRATLERAAALAGRMPVAQARERPFLPLVLAAAAAARCADGRLAAAAGLLDDALVRFPDAPELAFGRGEVARRAGAWEVAVARLDACRGLPAPAHYPSDPRLRTARPCLAIARAALAAGDLALAATALDAAAAHEPPDPEARALAARVRLLAGDVDGGMADAGPLLADEAAHPAVAFLGGWLARLGGDPASAEALFAQAAAGGDDGDEAHGWLAVCRLERAGAAACDAPMPVDVASAGAAVLVAVARGEAPALDAGFDRAVVERTARAWLEQLDGPAAAAVRAAVAASPHAAAWGLGDA